MTEASAAKGEANASALESVFSATMLPVNFFRDILRGHSAKGMHLGCKLSLYTGFFISQIAIAIGVLTSNRGKGDEPLWRIGRGTRVPLQGAVDVVQLLGAIVGWGGRVTTNFWGVETLGE